MVSKVNTVAFQGIEARPVDVQVMIAPGKMHFSIVGLPDKAVAESRERVQAALHASGLSLPHKRITVNLAPADLPKEGSHYDLPIALGLMAGLGAIPSDVLNDYVVLGELSLDGSLANIVGALPAAIGANARGKGLICPASSGGEAAWADRDMDILSPPSLIALANHFRGTQILSRPLPAISQLTDTLPDMADIKGQETAKRALEIAAAGGHNLLMAGPPGSGKSMLAALAHNGVLFLDEFPEFSPQVLDSLRQPIEAGETTIARANHRITYPSRIQLIAAMNPCRCGMAGEPGHTCKRGDRCATDYQARISGPLLDRIDLRVDVPAVSAMDMIGKTVSEASKDVAQRVLS